MRKFLILAIFGLFLGINNAQAIDLPELPEKAKQNTLEQTQKAFAQNPQVQQAVQAENLYDLGMSYDKAITKNKPIVLLFYTNWCSACKRALPLIKAQQEKYQDKYIFTTLNAEDTTYSDTIKDYRLRCFPTVYIIDPKYDNRIHIEVSYIFNADAFSKELDRYLNIRNILDSAKK